MPLTFEELIETSEGPQTARRVGSAARRGRLPAPFDDAWKAGKRGRHGRGLCRMCGREVPRGRYSWCGPKCVARWARTGAGMPRGVVWLRDEGVCGDCGIDTNGLWDDLKRVADKHVGHRDHWNEKCCTRKAMRTVRSGFLGPYQRPMQARTAECPAIAFLGAVRNHGSLWEADHIVPIAEGGVHALSNLRTLCIWCHRKATRALTARLAEKRAAASRLL